MLENQQVHRVSLPPHTFKDNQKPKESFDSFWILKEGRENNEKRGREIEKRGKGGGDKKKRRGRGQRERRRTQRETRRGRQRRGKGEQEREGINTIYTSGNYSINGHQLSNIIFKTKNYFSLHFKIIISLFSR